MPATEKIMDFIFKHPESGKEITVTIADNEIRDRMEDDDRDKMDCGCQPIGESNVVECNCCDYFDGFKLQAI